MKRQDFYFDLPSELIAQYPTKERSASRLMCVDGNTGACLHKQFRELPQLLAPGDLLVFNNTRVIPARLFGRKETGGQVEMLVERVLSEQAILAHVKASKSPKPGCRLLLDGDYYATVRERQGDLFVLDFATDQPVFDILEAIGHIPLPPYIERHDEDNDKERYQTVYAEKKGAVAAPTAGLHFDESLLAQLKNQGIETAFVTLHVGAGTFQPVRVDDIYQHHMHAEYIEVNETVCQQVAATKARGGKVIAVGTTSVRCLESASQDGSLKPYTGDTDIFIYPGYEFQMVDVLITNFHLPESTLLMLVSAFAGYEHMLAAYRLAVQEKYRFFSYGDAMFLTRKTS